MSKAVEKARKLMYRQTLKNKAPAWGLTEIAALYGEKLAKKYRVDKECVLLGLYLAHTVFSTEIRGDVQRKHEELSACYAEKYLKRWKVPKRKREIILNAIRAHHGKIKTQSKTAEVMKNAECFKFLTVSGALVYLRDLGSRGMPLKKVIEEVKYKAKQKLGYMTLPQEKKIARKNYAEIIKLLEMNRN